MSSNYYGSIAGEIADEGTCAEAAFLEWVNEYTRSEPHATIHDELRAAFDAGTAYGRAPAASDERKRRAAELCRPLMEASDADLRDALILIGAEKRKLLRSFLRGKSAESGED